MADMDTFIHDTYFIVSNRGLTIATASVVTIVVGFVLFVLIRHYRKKSRD